MNTTSAMLQTLIYIYFLSWVEDYLHHMHPQYLHTHELSQLVLSMLQPPKPSVVISATWKLLNSVWKRVVWKCSFPVVFSLLPEGVITHWSRYQKRNPERRRKWESSMCLNNTRTRLSDPVVIASAVAMTWRKYSSINFHYSTTYPGVYEKTKPL